MNIDLLNRVADQIEAHPENLAMDNWTVTDVTTDLGDYIETREAVDMVPECGTAACVAGWTLIESGYEPRYSESMHLNERNGKWYKARNLSSWLGPDGAEWGEHESGLAASVELGYIDSDEADKLEDSICPVVRLGGYDVGRLFFCTWYGPKTIVHLLRQWAENPDTECLDLPEGWDVTE